jgi:DNA-binding transcriptional LysR family regulator
MQESANAIQGGIQGGIQPTSGSPTRAGGGGCALLANVELRQLRYFMAIAEELHFRRAAERLYVTQPALSRQIAQLEHEIGVRLFHRNRRRVELTLAGSVLLDSLRQAFVQLEHSLANARWADQHGRFALQAAGGDSAPYIQSWTAPAARRSNDAQLAAG